MSQEGIGAALAQGIGTGLNALFTGFQNRRQRRWANQMYQRQYKDSLAFWNMQNQYNTPQAQMQRFQDAGLNPNLVYGQGSSGNASAPNVPTTPSGQFNTPDFSGIGAILPQFMDMEIKQATYDNLLTDNTVKLEQAELLRAQRASTLQGTKRSEFDLALDTELRDISAQARRENLRQLVIGNEFQMAENERRNATTSASLRESVQRVLNMRLEGRRLDVATRNLWKDNRLKTLEIELRELGLNPNSPFYMRAVARIANGFSSNDLKGTGKSFWDGFKTGNKNFWDSLNIFK